MARINKDNLTLAMMRIDALNESIIDRAIKQLELNGFEVKIRTFEDIVILRLDNKHIIEFNKEYKIFEWIDTYFYDRYLIPYRNSLDIVSYVRIQIGYRRRNTKQYGK